MADVTNIKVYAGFLMNEAEGLCDKLSKARGYYATMLADGANLPDVNGNFDAIEACMNSIGNEIFTIMRLINIFLDDLTEDEGKEGEEHGEEI